jgi:hypothetical protein
MNPALIQWGPALLILFGIVLGVMYNNRSFNHLDSRMNDLIRNEEIRHTDLKDLIKSEIRRVEERIARLEQPVTRS